MYFFGGSVDILIDHQDTSKETKNKSKSFKNLKAGSRGCSRLNSTNLRARSPLRTANGRQWHRKPTAALRTTDHHTATNSSKDAAGSGQQFVHGCQGERRTDNRASNSERAFWQFV